MAEKFFELNHVTHVYRSGEGEGHEALRGVTLSVAAGEFVAVLGANGSGKSTLARHLNALLLPSAGTCLVRGWDTKDEMRRWDIRQEVSMVFQNPDNQLIAAVVADDVAFGPENLGVPPAEIRARVQNALALVGMESYAQAAPHLLSGGQKQRIAIAGAIAMQTHCLVLDEPTAMLDPRGRTEVLNAVQKLHKEQGMTIVYITHFMEEAIAADRIVLMDAGRVVMDGTPHEVFTQTEKVRAFVLDIPLVAALAEHLRRGGRELPSDIITDEELLHCLSK